MSKKLGSPRVSTCILNNILPEFTNFYTNMFKPNAVDNNNKF